MGVRISYLVSNIDSQEPTGACIVAMDEECVVGSLGLRLSGPGAFINSLFVAEEARGSGVATKLVCRAIDIGRAHNKQVIGLTVHNDNTRAQSLYRRLGFVPYDKTTDDYTEYVRVIIPPEPL